jgi:protocatechuate 3,4-dioxygenase beta subunit
MTHRLSRRTLLGYGLGSAFLLGCGGRGGRGAAPHDARPLAPTPAIDDGDDDPIAAQICEPTADNIEGPYFKDGAPHRAVLAGKGDDGERLALGGRVLSTGCAPLAGVVIDLWHADAAGGYDMKSYRWRGKLTTDADGRWSVATIIPGRYLNGKRYRPAHIHAMLRADGHRPLTTQLYFEGDPYNDGDPFIVESLIMALARDAAGARAGFDFVLEPA